MLKLERRADCVSSNSLYMTKLVNGLSIYPRDPSPLGMISPLVSLLNFSHWGEPLSLEMTSWCPTTSRWNSLWSMDSFQGLTPKSPSSWHRSLAPSPNFLWPYQSLHKVNHWPIGRWQATWSKCGRIMGTHRRSCSLWQWKLEWSLWFEQNGQGNIFAFEQFEHSRP